MNKSIGNGSRGRTARREEGGSDAAGPRASNLPLKSLNFWFEMVLMGEVYMVLVQCLVAIASAYSATTCRGNDGAEPSESRVVAFTLALPPSSLAHHRPVSRPIQPTGCEQSK